MISLYRSGKSVVRQISGHVLENGERLVNVFGGYNQRRCETQRIGGHRIDDEPVFEAVVHDGVGAGMLELYGIEQTTTAHGYVERIAGGHNAIAQLLAAGLGIGNEVIVLNDTECGKSSRRAQRVAGKG